MLKTEYESFLVAEKLLQKRRKKKRVLRHSHWAPMGKGVIFIMVFILKHLFNLFNLIYCNIMYIIHVMVI